MWGTLSLGYAESLIPYTRVMPAILAVDVMSSSQNPVAAATQSFHTRTSSGAWHPPADNAWIRSNAGVSTRTRHKRGRHKTLVWVLTCSVQFDPISVPSTSTRSVRQLQSKLARPTPVTGQNPTRKRSQRLRASLRANVSPRVRSLPRSPPSRAII